MKRLLWLLLFAPLLAIAQPTPASGVGKIVAGTNITISPTSGTGPSVTINSSGGGGGTPGGANTQLQRNADGAFGGITGATSDGTTVVLTSPTITTKLNPTTDDGAPLGDTTHNWSDLFMASAAVINFANGNVVVTHSSGVLTMTTGIWALGSSTATTQSAGDNSTKVATTAFVAAATTTGTVVPIAIFSVDGGGAAITTGTVSGTKRLPFPCTLTGYSITATGATGTTTIKIWCVADGTAIPTISNVINTSGVSLSTGTAVKNTTLSDFTDTTYAALDMMRCAITAVDGTATDLTVTLYGTRL